MQPLRYSLALVTGISLLVFFLGVGALVVGSIYQLSLVSRLILEFAVALITGLTVSWVTVGTSPIIREILATFRLMTRLESLSHPLLLRLSLEAPGTYHHSLQVGALADTAARSIGADQLLARLGGYYHDIGKLTKPEYFIENQYGGTNPLDSLTPKQAARVIIAHIDDGLALATAYRLPTPLLGLIAQHTGTTTVRYFLERARSHGKRNLNEDEFRYPGPKPQTREAGIVMLADAIEAKARLLPDTDRATLQHLVDETFHEKEKEQQLELAGFQPGDLSRLQTSFTDALATMLHQRIAYPAPTKHTANLEH